MTRLISILAIAIALSGCAMSANFGSDAEANKTQVRLVSGTFDVVYRAAVQTAAQMNWTIKTTDQLAGFFHAETPQRMSVWGDEVNVTIEESEKGVLVTVKSNLGQEPNRKVIANYLDAIEERLNK